MFNALVNAWSDGVEFVGSGSVSPSDGRKGDFRFATARMREGFEHKKILAHGFDEGFFPEGGKGGVGERASTFPVFVVNRPGMNLSHESEWVECFEGW